MLFGLSACHSSRQAKGDYPDKNSLSKNEVASKSPKRSSKKEKRASAKFSSANEEFLEPVSSVPAANSTNKKDVDRSKDKKSIRKNDNRRLTTDLIAQADKLIGTDYRYGGTSPSRGFDCSGFTSYVFNKMEIDIPRTSTDQSRTGKRKNFKDADVGDLVFFGTGNRVSHVGIVVSKAKNRMEVIHSTSSSGVRRDEIFGSEYWSSRTLWAVDFYSLGLK